MKYIFSTVLFFVLLACVKKDQTVSTPKTKTYQLVWQDDFTTNGPPDSLKWRFEHGFLRNEEAQWYQRENAVCENGQLVITGNKERKPNPNYVAGSTDWKTKREFIEYTSASVVMQKEHAFQYGKMEVRARIDAQTGLWPAIWTLGTFGEWPSNGEVDVMEYYDEKILANFAYGSATRWQAIWDGASKSVASFGGALWANQFHIWTLEWDESMMRILLDGQLMNSIDLNQTFNKIDGKNPFRQPHYLLLNLAMGGNSGGSLANTILPSKYMIDYVRIYQKQ
ncbi:glycoside hydrolase family 16 protein [Lacibacter sp. H407]|uniref:glycoside hydrolase family 16 protein n=1 Tax=Lacibacter sp. H407 TaxID=3133423 RepID=UPI0030BE3E4F